MLVRLVTEKHIFSVRGGRPKPDSRRGVLNAQLTWQNDIGDG